ncbi:phytoene/squalene synthase family protein [Deinococcus sp. KSM4-11]|uniref:phytoene/squalene synthase family protein n=1 Tax=Deinococcus sp. KSM4-11 TaxID=2568654 RepID=UPI001F0F00BB|nr:phytoene/squalene synthase family protein [Deinococcus sp. KSM4-11]
MNPAPAAPATLQEAVAHCRDVTRAHSKTFYLGSRFFPSRQRQAVWAVYAACRDGDDIADELSGEHAQVALADWWARTQRAFHGPPGPHPVEMALAWAAQTYDIPLAAFEELHDGLLMDVCGHTFEDMDDLTLYCRRVAGVVGFMIAPISGYHGGPRTLDYALKLGQAMQLTNILRDVGEDLARGRVYLPLSEMKRHGVTRTTLEAGTVTPEYRAMMLDLTALAREWYAQGRRGIPLLHGSARLAVATAARAYEGILDDLARNDFDNFGRRAYVSGPRKLLMVPRVWWELRSPPLP